MRAEPALTRRSVAQLPGKPSATISKSADLYGDLDGGSAKSDDAVPPASSAWSMGASKLMAPTHLMARRAPQPKAPPPAHKRVVSQQVVTVVQEGGGILSTGSTGGSVGGGAVVNIHQADGAGESSAKGGKDSFAAQQFEDEYDPARPNEYHAFLKAQRQRKADERRRAEEERRRAAPAAWEVDGGGGGWEGREREGGGRGRDRSRERERRRSRSRSRDRAGGGARSPGSERDGFGRDRGREREREQGNPPPAFGGGFAGTPGRELEGGGGGRGRGAPVPAWQLRQANEGGGRGVSIEPAWYMSVLLVSVGSVCLFLWQSSFVYVRICVLVHPLANMMHSCAHGRAAEAS